MNRNITHLLESNDISKNKYFTWYSNIIQIALTRTSLPSVYTEKHHIFPKSLGGDNLSDNIVRLSAREHFICHLLLPKFLTGKHRAKMSYALNMMLKANERQSRDFKINSYVYQYIKEEYIKNISGENSPFYGRIVSQETRDKQSKIRKGKKRSKESVEKTVLGRKGYKHSEETKQKIRETRIGKSSWNKGVSHSEETKAKISQKAKGRIQTSEERLKRSQSRKNNPSIGDTTTYKFVHSEHGEFTGTRREFLQRFVGIVNASGVSALLNGKNPRSIYKGWTFTVLLSTDQ